MAMIKYSNATFVFPNFEGSTRSLKNTMFNRIFGLTGFEKSPDDGASKNVSGLFNLDLEIHPGDRLGIVGPNGAGKTTLLRSLSGVYSPVTGDATIKGSIGSLLSIGIGTDALATGMENIFIRGINLGLKIADIQEMVPQIVDFSELGDAIFKPVRTYSSGMYMKLMFSIVTSFKKDIVLMDEWLSVGDYSFNQKAEVRLGEFVDQSEIFVLASHSRRQIEKLCNRAIFIENGCIKYDGNPHAVCSRYWDG